MNLRTGDVEAFHERIQQVDRIHHLLLVLAWRWRKRIRLVVHFRDRIFFLFIRCFAEQRGVNGVAAGNLLLVQHLNAAFQRLFIDELFDVIRHDGQAFGRRHVEVLAFVQAHLELEVAHSQPVAVKQSPWIALAERMPPEN